MSSGVKAIGRKRAGDRGGKQKASLSVTSYINKALGKVRGPWPSLPVWSLPTLRSRHCRRFDASFQILSVHLQL